MGNLDGLLAIATGTTCGFACWEAREDVCRCSCGGKNHGILRNGGKLPQRTCKIDGRFYRLEGVGGDVYARAREINEAVGPKETHQVTTCNAGIVTYTYYWRETEPGAPARVKPATANQKRWPELAPFAGQYVYLLWVRDDTLAPTYK